MSLGLGDAGLVSYEIGFGNLRRYLQEHRPATGDWVVVDDFWLVVPRTTDAGRAELAIGDAAPIRAWSAADDTPGLAPFAEVFIDQPNPILNWE